MKTLKQYKMYATTMKYFLIIFFLHVNISYSQTIKIGTIQVSTSDLPGYYTRQQIKDYLNTNPEWRLPNIEELQTIYNNRNSLTGLKYGLDSYLASGNQNNYKFPNSQAEYGWAEAWSLEFANGRWVQPSASTQLCIRLVKKESAVSSSNIGSKEPKENKTKSNKVNSNSGECITTYSASYGLSGLNFDQPEIVFNLETTYPSNERFTQLYRWRYTMGNFRGLIFEYNNRMYFGKGRDYDNSKWYLQGKIGYGLLKSISYYPGQIYSTDPTGFITFNTETLIDNRHFNLNYGLALGYKFIKSDRLVLDLYMGYSGMTSPNFNFSQYNSTIKELWETGIGSPFEFQWSVGFFLD
jgi:hypothetical protein